MSSKKNKLREGEDTQEELRDRLGHRATYAKERMVKKKEEDKNSTPRQGNERLAPKRGERKERKRKRRLNSLSKGRIVGSSRRLERPERGGERGEDRAPAREQEGDNNRGRRKEHARNAQGQKVQRETKMRRRHFDNLRGQFFCSSLHGSIAHEIKANFTTGITVFHRCGTRPRRPKENKEPARGSIPKGRRDSEGGKDKPTKPRDPVDREPPRGDRIIILRAAASKIKEQLRA